MARSSLTSRFEESAYEDTLPLWEDLLAGISTDAASDDRDADADADADEGSDEGSDEDADRDNEDAGTGDDDTDEDVDDSDRDADSDDEDADNDRDADSDDDTSSGNAETGLDDNVFTDAEIGFTVEFDDETWEAELIEGDFQPLLFLVIAEEPSYANASIDGSFGYGEMTPADCVGAYVDSLPDVGPYDDFEEADDLALPETDGDAAATVYRYTYTFQDGEVAELVGYMECRRTGDDSMVRIFIQIDEESYEEQVEVLEDLLAGITVTGASSTSTDNESPPDEETDDAENEDADEEAA